MRRGRESPAPSNVTSRATVCFFCRVEDPAILERVEFYAQDLRALRELGFDVRVATRPREIRPADLYFGWWWTWGFVPTIAGRMLRRPVILTGVFDEWAFPGRSAPARFLHRFALASATANVFVSEFEHRTVPRSLRVRRPLYCPLTVDTDVYTPGTAPRENFLLCIAGSGMHRGNAKRKCIEELVRAFAVARARRPDLRLVLIGHKGSDHGWLDAVARDCGVAGGIDFTGVVSRDTKIDLLRRCGLYVQPSRFEGFGLSILEAMACGAPVVSSPVGAVPELVGDAAVLVDGTDPEQIAAAIGDAMAAPESRARMGAAARARAVASYPYARRKSFIAALCEELLGRGSGGRLETAMHGSSGARFASTI